MTDVVVLGLDGVSWNAVDDFIHEGRMPNLAELRRSGYIGTLESTTPPITAPAWLSMATGQNPGKTGVFYFLNRTDPDSFDFEPMGVADFRGRSFWDVLNARGHSVGVFNFPMLHPPYEIDGFVVSGFGAGDDTNLTYPASLRDEIDEVTGGYEVKVPYADPKYTDDPELLERDLHRIVEKREAAIEYLLTEKRPDVFFGVVSATDWAQHYFWRYHDPDHVFHEPGHEDALADLFARVDETLGKVANIAREEDATLLLVSDHGFGPVNGTFYANEWLEREGFRVPASFPLSKLRSTYFPYLRRVLEPVVGRVPLLRDVAKRVGRSVRVSPLESVDTERSVAFTAKQGLTSGLLYLLSDDPTDRGVIAETLRETCYELGLSVDIYRPEEIYDGPKTDVGPDLVFEVEGLEYAVDPRYSTADDVVVDRPPAPARSGGHRHEGIYVVSGPEVDADEGPPRPLLDIAPTILALQSAPIPTEMDGESMDEAVSVNDIERRRLSDIVDGAIAGDRGDAEKVRKQLEDLGYL